MTQQLRDKLRAGGVSVPAAAPWLKPLTEVVRGRTEEIGAVWVVPADDPRRAVLHSHLFEAFAHLPDEVMTGRENWYANWLVASRAFDVIEIVRQRRIVDYRKKGAEYDRKIAEVIARNTAQRRARTQEKDD